MDALSKENTRVEFLEPGSRLSYPIFIFSLFISYPVFILMVVHPVFILVALNTRRLISPRRF